MVTIVDYGASNLSSVAKAVAKIGYNPVVTSDPNAVEEAQAIILPGVGAAGDAMSRLESAGLKTAITRSIDKGVPFLGICLGLQVLLTESRESGGRKCLDIISGSVLRLPPGIKVPHIGWNQVSQKRRHPVLDGIPDNSFFYFVHSYYVSPTDRNLIVGETNYGLDFCSLLIRDNLVATQFHPEKSGKEGLHLLANFLMFAGFRT
ncbi:MAG: imidazole glycerol phosphate synthase subunit HisH [Chloroflexi bacterium]|nr:imidazole glycerol phosphate synthase subunit HisH [Chloroflexota bacterium]